MAKLCVNVDHIATLRQARREERPDPVEVARAAEAAGAIGITVHLREDRRHIQDHDLTRLKRSVRGKLNLEMALTPAMIRVALQVKPEEVTLVPEKRQELTTEGGLNVAGQLSKVRAGVKRLKKSGAEVSLFIDPQARQVWAAYESGAPLIELHTGAYAGAYARGGSKGAKRELARLQAAASLAQALGLKVNAGHGLKPENVRPVAAIRGMLDLNIGHALVARSVMVGIKSAVREMLAAMRKGSA